MQHSSAKKPKQWLHKGAWLLILCLWMGPGVRPLAAQGVDILTAQLRTGFGKNKVRYKNFDWWIIESEHFQIHYEPEFEALAEKAVYYLEKAYDHVSEIMRHELSHKPPIIIFKSNYEFQQTNVIQQFLPPGVAGFAEPLRHRVVTPYGGDLDDFRETLTHELMHIFEFDLLYKGPLKRISGQINSPPTWIMEGMAEYAKGERNTIDEMVLRDAVLNDQLIPLRVMNAAWGTGNVFLAYKQSHSLIQYIAANYGPEKIGRILRVWDSGQQDTNLLLERLIGLDMDTLNERWAAALRKEYWPMLQTRDYMSEIAEKVAGNQRFHLYAHPTWSLGGDMVAALSTDGVEQHVDIIRLNSGERIARITSGMRTRDYDQLTFGAGTVAWAPNGRSIAFVAKKGPRDIILVWDLYEKKLKKTLGFDLEIIENLNWAPDSRRLAFVGTSYGQADIYTVDVPSGELTQITGTPQRDDYPAFSPEGTRLAFSAKRKDQYDIEIYDLKTGEEKVAIQTPYDDMWPNWFPEGDKILFASTRDKINDLFVYHLEEQREYRLTRTISGIMSPTLSPDGRQVLMSVYFQGRRQLYRMDMPTWPEIKRKDRELAARVHEPVAAAPAEPKAPADSLAAAPPERVDVERAVALLGQKTRTGKVVKLASASESSAQTGIEALSDAGASFARPEPSVLPRAQVPVQGEVGEKLALISKLPKHRYSPKLEFDGVSLQVGLFNGFLSSVGQLSMSDLLGNHSLSLASDYIASNDITNDFNFSATYSYYGKRPTYRGSVFNWSQFFNDTDNRVFLYRGRFVRGLVRSQQTGFLGEVSYPIDVYRRLELSYIFVSEQRELIFPVKEGLEDFNTQLFKVSYVHDSINFGLLGPTSGSRWHLSAGRTLNLSSRDRSFSHLELDFRNYTRLGRWSVFGVRALGIGSLGPDGFEYTLGGPAWFLPFFNGFNLNTGPLRGYRFSELAGSRVLLLNNELRVPLVRNLTFGWPGNFSIPAVDGAFFVDMGTAWDRDENLDLSFQKPGTEPEPGTQRLRASMGFGLLVYFIAPMNFEWAKQTDFREVSDWRFHFSFGKSF